MKLLSLGLSAPEKRGNPLDNPAVSLNSIDGWGWMFDGGRGSDAGEVINNQTALKISTVYSCVRVLLESVASLPVRLLRITPQGRVQELEDPLYHLLAVAPNPETTSFVYCETVAFHLSLTGNSYSEIERAEDGSPVALWPLNPRLTRAIRVSNGDLKYETQDGETGGNKRIIDAANMLHVPLMSFDGIDHIAVHLGVRRIHITEDQGACRIRHLLIAANIELCTLFFTLIAIKDAQGNLHTESQRLQVEGIRVVYC